jgi:hypothetical protein
MQFFVVARDRATGTLALPDRRVFDGREEALSAARAALETAPGDLFIADLDGAAPVLVLTRVAGGEVGPQSAAARIGPVEEAPGSDQVDVAVAGSGSSTPDTAPASPPVSETSFAEAIREAAASLGLDTGEPSEETIVEGTVSESVSEPDLGRAAEEAADHPCTAEDVEPQPGPAYVPSFTDLDSWTCADCIYLVTCPKSGADRPANCGSFQWKTV